MRPYGWVCFRMHNPILAGVAALGLDDPLLPHAILDHHLVPSSLVLEPRCESERSIGVLAEYLPSTLLFALKPSSAIVPWQPPLPQFLSLSMTLSLSSYSSLSLSLIGVPYPSHVHPHDCCMVVQGQTYPPWAKPRHTQPSHGNACAQCS